MYAAPSRLPQPLAPVGAHRYHHPMPDRAYAYLVAGAFYVLAMMLFWIALRWFLRGPLFLPVALACVAAGAGCWLLAEGARRRAGRPR